jgi:glutamate synthase domain-containing protein 1
MMKTLVHDDKIMDGCGLAGILSRGGKMIEGKNAITMINSMRVRGNGLGAGFAAYGIFPKYSDKYALQVMISNEMALMNVESYLETKATIVASEKIPVNEIREIVNPPSLWRFFLEVPEKKIQTTEEDNYIISLVMYINENIEDAFVLSSGKNMGVFKAVGHPNKVAEFYRLETYKGYLWLAHTRFPTNTPGWWGGAHPFNILDWSVIHNGEISSYGTNKRYLEMYGYKCTLLTDTEVVAYLFDLLVRRHKLPLALACEALAPRFWSQIEREPSPQKKRILKAIRLTYGSALLNGPFSILVANRTTLLGLNDRIKLRPLIVGVKDDKVYMASEEQAIRSIEKNPEDVWAPKAGHPVIAKLQEEYIEHDYIDLHAKLTQRV